MPPTEQQMTFFDIFGHVSFPGLFARKLNPSHRPLKPRGQSTVAVTTSAPTTNRKNSALLPFIDRHPFLCGLLDDERVEGIGAGLRGVDSNYRSNDGNYFVGDTVWHSDGYLRAPGYHSIKLAFCLNIVGRDADCLKFIPGSRKVGDAGDVDGWGRLVLDKAEPRPRGRTERLKEKTSVSHAPRLEQDARILVANYSRIHL